MDRPQKNGGNTMEERVEERESVFFLATNRCEGVFFLCFVTGERRME